MIKFYISKMIRKICFMSSIRDSSIHKTAKVGNGCAITQTTLGKYSYVGDNTNITETHIGAFCSISSYCSIGGGGHAINWVSTSPVFTTSRSILRKNFSKNQFITHKKTFIGNDVWIGTHSMIKSGVTIADGAVIGMGAVVTTDVGPYEIWAGVPARFIRKRFDDDTIAAIRNSEWWKWDDKKICKEADTFNDIEKFISKVEKRRDS